LRLVTQQQHVTQVLQHEQQKRAEAKSPREQTGGGRPRRMKTSSEPEKVPPGEANKPRRMKASSGPESANKQVQPLEEKVQKLASQGGGAVGCDEQLVAERAWLAREREQGRNEEAANARWEAGRQAWLRKHKARRERKARWEHEMAATARWEAGRQAYWRKCNARGQRKARGERKRRKQNGCTVQAQRQHATAVREQAEVVEEPAVAAEVLEEPAFAVEAVELEEQTVAAEVVELEEQAAAAAAIGHAVAVEMQAAAVEEEGAAMVGQSATDEVATPVDPMKKELVQDAVQDVLKEQAVSLIMAVEE
jgi:hypothetical protein